MDGTGAPSAMLLEGLFQDKTLKAKAKVAMIGDMLLSQQLGWEALTTFAQKQKPAAKATCMEAAEFATRQNPAIADAHLLGYVCDSLTDEEPRVKWESARVIGNIAALFEGSLDIPIKNLLYNTDDTSTVVRWATAYALAEILKLKSTNNLILLPQIEAICENEQDNGVKKKYLDVLKKVKK